MCSIKHPYHDSFFHRTISGKNRMRMRTGYKLWWMRIRFFPCGIAQCTACEENRRWYECVIFLCATSTSLSHHHLHRTGNQSLNTFSPLHSASLGRKISLFYTAQPCHIVRLGLFFLINLHVGEHGLLWANTTVFTLPDTQYECFGSRFRSVHIQTARQICNAIN